MMPVSLDELLQRHRDLYTFALLGANPLFLGVSCRRATITLGWLHQTAGVSLRFERTALEVSE